MIIPVCLCLYLKDLSMDCFFFSSVLRRLWISLYMIAISCCLVEVKLEEIYKCKYCMLFALMLFQTILMSDPY